MCMNVCVCSCTLKHTNTESCSFWKAASREAANTARGRLREEQNKQGTYTGENRHTRVALGHTILKHTHELTRIHACILHPRKHTFPYPTHFHISIFDPFYSLIVFLRTSGEIYKSCCTAISKHTAFDPFVVHNSAVSQKYMI